jgi:hypothetical protein
MDVATGAGNRGSLPCRQVRHPPATTEPKGRGSFCQGYI